MAEQSPVGGVSSTIAHTYDHIPYLFIGFLQVSDERYRYDELMAVKAECVLTKFGDVAGAKNPHLHEVGRT